MHPPTLTTARPPGAARLVTTLAVAFTTAVAAAQDPWTDLGCAHPGASGPPSLVGSGTLQAGQRGALDLSDAAPSALAQLFVGLSPVSLPFKGGTLKALPVLSLPTFTTSGNGALALPFTWPLALPQGSELTFQYAIADAGASNGVALSNALLATAPLPIPSVDSFGPTSGTVGTVITLSGDGFTEGPEDYCVQVVGAGGQILGFSRATATGRTTLDMEILGAVTSGSQGSVIVAAGEGVEFVPSSVPSGMSVVGNVWFWTGDTSNTVTAPGSFQFTPATSSDTTSSTCHTYYVSVNSSGTLQVDFPTGTTPCPVDTNFTLQLDVESSGGTIDFFDHWACLENDVPLSAVDCANKLCQTFQQAFFDRFGVFLSCSTQVVGGVVQILVQPPAGESWVGSGLLQVCADGLADCTAVTGGLAGGSIEIPVECPTDGGTATYLLEGELTSGTSFSFVASLSIPDGLDAAQCANHYCVEIADEILAQTGLTVTCAAAGSSILVLPPFLDSWDDAFVSMTVCPTP